jgi:hypothetical protein
MTFYGFRPGVVGGQCEAQVAEPTDLARKVGRATVNVSAKI